MGGFSRLKRQSSIRYSLSSRMSSFMSQDLDLPWTTSAKDNNNSLLQYPIKSSSSSTVLGKSNNKSNNRTKSISKLPLFKSNKKISIITRGVSPTITVISETSSSSSSSSSEEGEGEGFEVDVNILSSDDTVYNNLDNSDYNNTNSSNSSARSGELSSAHSGSLTTFANNYSPPILIPADFDIEMDIVKSTNGGDGIIESLSSLDKSSKSRRSSSPKSVRSRLTVTPIVEFCTDNNETVLGSVKEDLSLVDKQMNNLVEVVMDDTSNNNKDIKEKICHILVDELGSSIETLRSGGSVLSTNTSGSNSSGSGEQPKMFILPEELTNVGSSIETLRSGSAISEKIFILPQEEGSRLSLDQEKDEKSRVSSSSSGRSQEEQGLQLDIDKLQAYETIMKHLTAYEEMSKLSGVQATSSPLVEVQKSKPQGHKKRSLLDRVGNHLDKKTYQSIMKRSRRRRSRRLKKEN